MKFLYIISALAATALAAPEALVDRDADAEALTCNYRCLAAVRIGGQVACPCDNQVRPCYKYNCQGGTQAIGGNNAQIFRRA